MNKFKKLGYIEYGERLRVHNSSLSGVLKDSGILRSACFSTELSSWGNLGRKTAPMHLGQQQIPKGARRLLFPWPPIFSTISESVSNKS